MSPGFKRAVRRWLPRTLKPHSIRSGPLRDYRIVTSWHDYPAAILGYTERDLLNWFARHVGRDETWLDVGAHYGYTAIALAHYVGKQGRVFAFEPVLSSASCIGEARWLNGLSQLTILPIGLSNTARLALTHLTLVRGMADRTAGTNQSHVSGAQETLLVVGLDAVWETLSGGDLRVHGVKIDVQGMELEVLQGMQNLLTGQQPRLVIEVHKGVCRSDLLAMLAKVGYTRPAMPIEAGQAGNVSELLDDMNYVFLPSSPHN